MADTDEPKPKKELTPEQQADRTLVRTMARAIWRVDPATKGLSAKAKKDSWTEGRRKFVTEARNLSKAMTKEGLIVTIAPAADDATK